MKLKITRRRLTLSMHPAVALAVSIALVGVCVGGLAASAPDAREVQVARLVAALIDLLLGGGSGGA